MAPVVATRALPFPALARVADAGHTIHTWVEPLPPTREELHALLRTHDPAGLLCTLSDPIDAEALDQAPALRAIATYAAGTDNVDLAAASQRGIVVGHTPDVLTDATADLAFALLLASARRLPEAQRAVAAGEWRTWEPASWLGTQVAGATLGIIGPGRIGSAVARRARGFDMDVLDSKSTELDELLARSDFVSLHCPLTPRTRHLIDGAALARMKPTAHLINTARGPIVDTDALVDALARGRLGGAALDVTDPEPLPFDHPLMTLPNALVVPHVGSATHQTREAMAEITVDNLLAGLAGEPLPHRANP